MMRRHFYDNTNKTINILMFIVSWKDYMGKHVFSIKMWTSLAKMTTM
jgi:hypothetical protein